MTVEDCLRRLRGRLAVAVASNRAGGDGGCVRSTRSMRGRELSCGVAAPRGGHSCCRLHSLVVLCSSGAPPCELLTPSSAVELQQLPLGSTYFHPLSSLRFRRPELGATLPRTQRSPSKRPMHILSEHLHHSSASSHLDHSAPYQRSVCASTDQPSAISVCCPHALTRLCSSCASEDHDSPPATDVRARHLLVRLHLLRSKSALLSTRLHCAALLDLPLASC